VNGRAVLLMQEEGQSPPNASVAGWLSICESLGVLRDVAREPGIRAAITVSVIATMKDRDQRECCRVARRSWADFGLLSVTCRAGKTFVDRAERQTGVRTWPTGLHVAPSRRLVNPRRGPIGSDILLRSLPRVRAVQNGKPTVLRNGDASVNRRACGGRSARSVPPDARADSARPPPLPSDARPLPREEPAMRPQNARDLLSVLDGAATTSPNAPLVAAAARSRIREHLWRAGLAAAAVISLRAYARHANSSLGAPITLAVLPCGTRRAIRRWTSLPAGSRK